MASPSAARDPHPPIQSLWEGGLYPWVADVFRFSGGDPPRGALGAGDPGADLMHRAADRGGDFAMAQALDMDMVREQIAKQQASKDA